MLDLEKGMGSKSAQLMKIMEAANELNEFNFDKDKFLSENENYKQYIVFDGIDDKHFNIIKDTLLLTKATFNVAYKEVSFSSTSEIVYDCIVEIDPMQIFVLKPIIRFWWVEEFLAFINDKNDPTFDEETINKLGLEKHWGKQIPEKLCTIINDISKVTGFSPISFGLPPYIGSGELNRLVSILMEKMMRYTQMDNQNTLEEDIKIWRNVLQLTRLYDRIVYSHTNILSKQLAYKKDYLKETFQRLSGEGETEKQFYAKVNLPVINELFQACFIMFDIDETQDSGNEQMLEIYDIYQELQNTYNQSQNVGVEKCQEQE